MLRWIDCIIFHLRFLINLIQMLIFAQSFMWRLIYAILNHLGKNQMDVVCPVCFWEQ